MWRSLLRPIVRKLFFAIVPTVAAQQVLLKVRLGRRNAAPARTADPSVNAILADIARDGYAVVPGYFSADECSDVIRDFDTAASRMPDFLHVGEDRRLYGAENVSVLAREFYSDNFWVNLASAYSNSQQTVFCTMANRIDFNGVEKFGSGGCWHRDGFARELKVILYVSDVSPDNGPFQFVRGSHNAIISFLKLGRLRLQQNRIGAEAVARILAKDRNRLVEFTAPAGTAIIFDDSGIHRGAPIRNGSRVALTNYIFATRVVSEETCGIYEPIVRAGCSVSIPSGRSGFRWPSPARDSRGNPEQALQRSPELVR